MWLDFTFRVWRTECPYLGERWHWEVSSRDGLCKRVVQCGTCSTESAARGQAKDRVEYFTYRYADHATDIDA